MWLFQSLSTITNETCVRVGYLTTLPWNQVGCHLGLCVSTFTLCFLSTAYESVTSQGDGNTGGIQRGVLLRLCFACVFLMLSVHFLQKFKTFCFILVSLLCHPGHLNECTFGNPKFISLTSSILNITSQDQHCLYFVIKRNVVTWLCYLPRAQGWQWLSWNVTIQEGFAFGF